mgnify:CR=1 FL=1
MLSDLLGSDKKIFKLVCGAGNECAQDVERLSYLYSRAGAQIFDICAKPEILEAAKRGLKGQNAYICVSVGMKGDPHIFKAAMNKNCTQCGICEKFCPQDAIKKNLINSEKCIGCSRCLNHCPNDAISMTEKEQDLKKVLPKLIEMGIDCIELHATSEIDADIWEKWDIINNCYDGIVSICIDRLNLGNKQVLKRLNKMLKIRKPYTTIIQADGIPMSGSNDDYKTTLQAVAMAEIIQDANMPVYILISGGTNSKTAKLANICNLNYQGIAIGSYARQIVKPYIQNADFYKEEIFNQALSKATELVKASII